ncbi:winged helix-turn-helix transcriptional regulator [Blautia schinkii]|uniref:winged helix-turn-helix domain-containing protein n=1 Tax=Blautia schinkii TaxID=180164 RepID=UPI00156DCBCA|nr:winged helix-turn-helix domain-containing protein [Blautia schinkii]NSG82167.1 winged helix-turn-helix transcriptional regulator [Blautia schinkii]NSK22770.1 winged helix-turn-helix transcriptional regulator [Blautia schinkii]NSK25810.1 winged helix-turn-helix transcriptional regulator [Blautia schinkii]NSK31782.1 winged helix-turn-helix transcriptional regulator [Blautia schinkii]NSK49242.1 winged helix-turn-helix transcriptional regulator [Blautia schinkii]
MRKEIWMHTQTNLSESLEKQEYTTLIQYASDNKEYVINEWYNSDNSSLSQILRYGNSQLNYFEHHLPTASKEDAIFQLGTLMGVIKTFKDFLHEKQQENLTAQIYQKQVLSVKHLKDIILLLEAHGIMSHSEICKNLDLKESTLSEIMKKAASTNLIISSKAGKYKLYRLSDNGRYLSRQLRAKTTVSTNRDELLKQLKFHLKASASENSFKDTIKKLLEYNDPNIKNEITNIKIAPGNTITVLHTPDKTIQKERYEITGIPINSKEDNGGDVTLMARKIKYDFDALDDIKNIIYEEKDLA